MVRMYYIGIWFSFGGLGSGIKEVFLDKVFFELRFKGCIEINYVKKVEGKCFR